MKQNIILIRGDILLFFFTNLLRVVLFVNDPIHEEQIQLITFRPFIAIWTSLSSYSANEEHVSQVNFQVVTSIVVIARWPGTHVIPKSALIRFTTRTRWRGWETFVLEYGAVGHINCLGLTRFNEKVQRDSIKQRVTVSNIYMRYWPRVRSRWLDIGQVQKKYWPKTQKTSLVNKGFIIWPKGYTKYLLQRDGECLPSWFSKSTVVNLFSYI